MKTIKSKIKWWGRTYTDEPHYSTGDDTVIPMEENTNNTEQGKPRSGITITDVKVVGNCSKHRKENEEPSKDIYGRVYDDNELVCIECNLQDNHEQSSEPTGLNSSDD